MSNFVMKKEIEMGAARIKRREASLSLSPTGQDFDTAQFFARIVKKESLFTCMKRAPGFSRFLRCLSNYMRVYLATGITIGPYSYTHIPQKRTSCQVGETVFPNFIRDSTQIQTQRNPDSPVQIIQLSNV